MQIDDTPRTQIVFGVNVDGLASGAAVTVDSAAFGYPIRSLKDVPPGEYTVQAVLNIYETFHRSDGSTVKLHMDQGEGQHWNISPGNLYSKPQKITLASGAAPIALSLTEEIPPHSHAQRHQIHPAYPHSKPIADQILGPPHVPLRSDPGAGGIRRASQLAFSEMVFEDHFVDGFDDFRTTPPDPNLKPDYSERFHLAGYNRIQQQEAYKTYQQWISPNFPRYLVIKIQHANPYYDDSYAVNSANLGPYGDAIETELMPAIEKQFRGIGQGWARFLYGGSTGGWESLAVQIFYPTHYNGAFVACPDPVDFHAYTNIDLYKRQKRLLPMMDAHKQIEQPAMRDYLGHTLITTKEINSYELALGDHGSLRRTVRHLAGRLFPEGPMVIRSRSSTKRRARSTTKSRPTGTTTTTSTRFSRATGRRSVPNFKASCTSMSAATILTF